MHDESLQQHVLSAMLLRVASACHKVKQKMIQTTTTAAAATTHILVERNTVVRRGH
jgi:hypothetical protein